jgi:hypothetical protein
MPSLLDLLMQSGGGTEGNSVDALQTAGDNPILRAFIQLQAQRAKDAVTAPRDAYTGDLQVWDPTTGHTTQEAMERAGGMAGIAMTGGVGGVATRAGETALGSGPVRKFGSMEELVAASRASRATQDARAAEIAGMLGSKGRFSTTGKMGETIGVTRSAREGGQYQVTTFADGQPSGHVMFDDPMKAASFIASNEATSSKAKNLGMGAMPESIQ